MITIDGFRTAKICSNGHMITDSAKTINDNSKFCKTCGASVISKCPHCQSRIHGSYHVDHVVCISSEEAPVPAYCHNCGKPYPWTEATMRAAEHIIDMLDELTAEQKKQLVDFIPDIIVETPQSRYAALVYANFLDGLQGLAVDCFKDWCKKNVFPALLVLLNMQKQ
ncbi:DUF2321 domain-containing protein [Phascolarctobacterium succinatutens]|uniref:DUF2321 domain-containing protein n=1 Tax=Phascolarctobacterium succinatutens TaxID=626940 RepID=UPI0023F8E76C|nr:DUF2321 domain-containing protein [Phascolarctobacterium succinatutens]